MKKILIFLLLIPMFAVGQTDIVLEDSFSNNQIDVEKDYIFQIMAPTMLLMELYMMELEKEKIHIGWDIIINEQVYDDGSSTSVVKSLYYPKAIDYLQPYQYDHDYQKNILYGFDQNEPIENYRNHFDDYGITEYVRTEKIIVPKKPSFQDFYYWTKEYFREQLKEEE
jgi:hypothetical protein